MRPKKQMLFSTLFRHFGSRDTHSSKYQTCSNCLDRDGEPCCEARLDRRGLLQREREPEPLALNGWAGKHSSRVQDMLYLEAIIGQGAGP